MIRFRRPNAIALNAPLATQSSTSVTYVEVGATQRELPAGFTHDELSIVIGNGHSLFEACSEHLNAWGLQRSLGLLPYPEDSRVADKITVLLSLPILGVTFVAACRVIYTIRNETQRGFAYGTLPMHPECGEEYFGVRIDGNEVVHFEIRAFSRPQSLLARAGGPITRHLQVKALHRYGCGMQLFADRFSVAS